MAVAPAATLQAVVVVARARQAVQHLLILAAQAVLVLLHPLREHPLLIAVGAAEQDKPQAVPAGQAAARQAVETAQLTPAAGAEEAMDWADQALSFFQFQLSFTLEL
jgi:hypothetical protein